MLALIPELFLKNIDMAKIMEPELAVYPGFADRLFNFEESSGFFAVLLIVAEQIRAKKFWQKELWRNNPF